MVEFSARVGAQTTGGHLGAMSCEDFNSRRRREYLTDFFIEAVEHLSIVARREGLEQLLWEPMPVMREGPVTVAEAERLFERVNRNAAVPIRYYLDLGHQCTNAVSIDDRDPYHWLVRLGPLCPYVHLQQTDGLADHHWPFTDDYNSQGMIDPERVIESLEVSGAEEVTLVFEIIHPFEAIEKTVLEDLRQSAEYWRQYLT